MAPTLPCWYSDRDRDIDLEAGAPQIVHTLRWGPSSQWYLDEPKTERSRRRVELASHTIEARRTHRRRQLEERLALGEAWQDHDVVFTHAIGGPLRPTRVHDRHTSSRGLHDWGCPRYAAPDMLP